MVAISVALAIGLDIAGAVLLVTALKGVCGRVGDTVSPLRPTPLSLLPLLLYTKNFTANY